MKKIKDYNATVQTLKQQGAIGATDVYAFCNFYRVFQLSDLLWALGGFISVGVTTEDYLVASDGNLLKIFNISQKTGEYLGKYIFLNKEQINKLSCKNMKLKIKSKSAKLRLNLKFKKIFRKFDQTNNLTAFLNVIQERFVGQVGKKS